ncbi:MAG: hypothetical protein PVF92_12055, partial [Desulfobacterales bacterium]
IATALNWKSSYPPIRLTREQRKRGCPERATRVAAGHNPFRPTARAPEAAVAKAIKSLGLQ